MLVSLRVRDLVLIDELDLALAPGFNVLTGETGAGKSLVAQAVSILLGRKVDGDVVRRGAETAEVEGLFDVSDEPGVGRMLKEAGLPAGDELLIRRVLPADGRQRCFLNGRLASLGLLTELALGLASFAGQHEHLALLEPANQRDILDEFAGLSADRERMASLAGAVSEAAGKLTALRDRERDRAQRLDWLSYQLREIDELSPAADEIEILGREVERRRHIAFLTDTASRATDELYERDGSVFERLGVHAKDLAKAATHDERFAGPARALADAAALVEEVARGMSGYGTGDESDPGRLDEIEDRRAALEALVRKHGLPLPELLRRRDEIAAEVKELSNFPEVFAEAERALEAARGAARRHADALSAGRRRGAEKLGKAVTAELHDLALRDAALRVGVESVDGEPGPTGADAVEFTVSLNPGEGAHALRRVASGGELSRLMLALRRALAGVGPVGTYVFDEVDAGIGGAQAALVGRKLREVAKHHQVLCITHLPQIAGLAEAHFVVRKAVEGGRTVTRVRRLTEGERVDEVARMLGGETLTDRTRAAARELFR